MRTIGAVLFALLMFVVGWLLAAVTMLGIGWVAAKAGASPGLFHTLAMWILGPLAGGYVAISASRSVFRTVNPSTVFVSFVTLISVLTGLSLLVGISKAVSGGSVGGLTIAVLQSAAMFGGAFLARAQSD